jgi:2',3'-cyclic-nucleotide 2'-phosphodiesterase (5'-nucleotidase family)
MDDLITAAYRTVTGAEIAVSHGWRYGAPIPPGPVTAGDLWQMVPPNPEVFTVKLTGAEIRRMLERSLERTFAGNPMRQQGGYVMRFDGMSAVARLNNPRGERLSQLEIGGRPVEHEREYTVAAAGEQSVQKREGRVGSGMRAVDAVREHLRRAGPVEGAHGGEKLVAI